MHMDFQDFHWDLDNLSVATFFSPDTLYVISASYSNHSLTDGE